MYDLDKMYVGTVCQGKWCSHSICAQINPNVGGISLSGKRVCDSPSIRVSEISVYYENRWVVPMLGKDLFTLHFAKA